MRSLPWRTLELEQITRSAARPECEHIVRCQLTTNQDAKLHMCYDNRLFEFPTNSISIPYKVISDKLSILMALKPTNEKFGSPPVGLVGVSALPLLRVEDEAPGTGDGVGHTVHTEIELRSRSCIPPCDAACYPVQVPTQPA